MVRSAVVCASLFLAAAPLPALAEGHYVVRNDTSRAFTCGLRRENRSVIDRFVIRSGGEWQQTSAGDGMRVLLCDSYKITPRYPMRSGISYSLVEDARTGRIVLRSVGPVE